MSFTHRAYTFLLCAIALPALQAQAAVIVENRPNTPNIVVPTFNNALGTLQSVQLNVTMLNGTTSSNGAHDHNSNGFLLSSNTVESDSASSINFPQTTRVTSFASSHSHSVVSPAYSGGGLSFSPFSISISPNSAHNHQVFVTFGGVSLVDSNPFGADDYRVRALLNPQLQGPHSHLYGGSMQSQSFAGGAVAPFLGASDIVIAAPNLTTSVNGTHTHQLTPFSVLVNTSEGPQSAQFPGSGLFESGHVHSIDTRFSTTATFTYEPVPEPSTGVLLVGGLAAFAVGRRRYR